MNFGANWCCTANTILKPPDPLDVSDRAIAEVIRTHGLITVSSSRYGGEQWFYASRLRAYDAKQTAYCAWCRTRNADHWVLFVLVCAEDMRVYDAARESHNERARNTLKHPSGQIGGGRH